MADFTNLTTNLPVRTAQTPQLDLILANYGNAFVKPLFFKPGDYPPQLDGAYDQHTAFPTRDNAPYYAGKPVIAQVGLSFDPYEIQQYNARTQRYESATINGQSISLGTVLLEVDQTKNIVTTSLNGRNGTVKEYIADDDYRVKIQGAIVNPNGTAYPEAEVKKMMQLVKAPVALKVTSQFLTLFGIYNLVIESYNFPQREGFTNTQFFELSCLSDNPVELVKLL